MEKLQRKSHLCYRPPGVCENRRA